MVCGIGMFINRWRGFKVFFNPLPGKFSYISQYTSHNTPPVKLIPIYHFIFLCDGVLIFGGHYELLDCIASDEVYLYPIFNANVLKVLTKSFSVRHYNVDVATFVVVVVIVILKVVLNFKPVENLAEIILSIKPPLLCPFSFCSKLWVRSKQFLLYVWEY